MIEISDVHAPLDALLPGNKVMLVGLVEEYLGKLDDEPEIQILKKSVDARKKSNVHFVLTLGVRLKCESDEVAALSMSDKDFALMHRRVKASDWNGESSAEDDETATLSSEDKRVKDALEKRKKCKIKHPAPALEIPVLSPKLRKPGCKRPVVIGTGPAGLFAALYLARSGLRPLVFERGACLEERIQAVESFEVGGDFSPITNIQFGEGGAGTFSDGKLTTNTKNPLTKTVLRWFVDAGAPEEILIDAKPHIGTDKLRYVVKNLREQIIAAGGEIFFNTRVSDFVLKAGRVVQIECVNEKTGETSSYPVSHVVVATGHSARDTFAMLAEKELFMEQKPFSVGVRIEHPQWLINQAQYGSFAKHPALGAADYKLSVHLPNGRSAYTFCMCPGGQVVAAASEEGGVVVNGMSKHARADKNANSAVLVNVEPADFGSDDVLAGVEFQRKLEHAAFELAQKQGSLSYTAPAQRVGSFLAAKNTPKKKRAKEQALSSDKKKNAFVSPSYSRGVAWADLHECLPDFVAETLELALPAFDKRISGFAHPDAVMTAVETRSSSPVRLVRSGNYQAFLAANKPSEHAKQAKSYTGIFPCGEGAGYAGGIMSAAVDGLNVARALVEDMSAVPFKQDVLHAKGQGSAQVKHQDAANFKSRNSSQTQGFERTQDSAQDFAQDSAQTQNSAQAQGSAQTQNSTATYVLYEYSDNLGVTYRYAINEDDTLCIMNVLHAGDTLVMPDYIEGKLISRIDQRAFQECAAVKSLVLPAFVSRLDTNVFRTLGALEELHLPHVLQNLEGLLLRFCSRLKTVVLGDMLERLPQNLLHASKIEHLVLGCNLKELGEAAFASSTLQSIEVSPDNPWLYTDGKALYSKKDYSLLALAVPCESYEALPECKAIGRKAFGGLRGLTHVVLPEGLQRIGEFAFFQSGVQSLCMPGSLESIDEKAFYQCRQLVDIKLNEGLKHIGSEAFADCALTKLELPFTLERVGFAAFGALTHTQEGFSLQLSFNAGNTHYHLDDQYGLYRKTQDGLVFEQLLCADTSEFHVLPGTIAIDKGAFARKRNLDTVVLPEGVISIGESAFQACANLHHITIPESLKRIEKDVFREVALRKLYLPAAFERLAQGALQTRGEDKLSAACSADNIVVHEDNLRFYTKDGMLCERVNDKHIRLIACFKPTAELYIPAEVTELSPLAFAGVRDIQCLHMHRNLARIGVNCFLSTKPPRVICLHDIENGAYSKSYTELWLPEKRIGNKLFRYPAESSPLDEEELHAVCDEAMLMCLEIFRRDAYALKRMDEKHFLSERMLERYRSLLRFNIEEICSRFSHHNYLTGLDLMCKFGFITQTNIGKVLEKLTQEGNVEAVSYMLELRRKYFDYDVFSEYDL